MMFDRHDLDVILFGVGLGSFGALAYVRWTPNANTGEAVLSGAMLGALVPVAVYGARVVARDVASVASGMIDFQRVVGEARIEQASGTVKAPSGAPLAHPLRAIPATVQERWSLALRQFLLAGKLSGGFSLRRFVKADYVSDTGYRALISVHRNNGILSSSNSGTKYAPGWTYARAVWHLKHERLMLPDGEPPSVTIGRGMPTV